MKAMILPAKIVTSNPISWLFFGYITKTLQKNLLKCLNRIPTSEPLKAHEWMKKEVLDK